MGIGIGDQDWGLGLGIGIGDLDCGIGLGIEDLEWVVEIWDYDCGRSRSFCLSVEKNQI